MSDADVLREAAALIRERAEAATPGEPRWIQGRDRRYESSCEVYTGELSATSADICAVADRRDAAHIASWDPGVTPLVADWLENAAEDAEMQSLGGDLRSQWDMRIHIATKKALAFACAYLGRDA